MSEISRANKMGKERKTEKTSERAKRRRRAQTALLAVALGFAPFAACSQTESSKDEDGPNGKFVVVGPADGDTAEDAPSKKTPTTKTAAQSGYKAFLVGADDYDDAPKLVCVKNDVEAFAERLIEIGVAEENVTVLKSGGRRRDEPTKANIENRFAEFVASLKPGDFAVVFLSGHGLQAGEAGAKEAFFAPLDLDPEDLFGSSVSIDKMLERLDKSRAKSRWMIVDACREAPDVWRQATDVRTRSLVGAKGLTSPIDAPESTALLQSCQAGEVSYEAGEHGFFTLSLLEALDKNGSKADKDNDGVLSFTELIAYVTERTDALARENGGASQRPSFSGEMTDFPVLNTRIEGLAPQRWREANALYEEAAALENEGKYSEALDKIRAAREINSVNEDYKNLENRVANALKQIDAAALKAQEEAAQAEAELKKQLEAERKAREEAEKAAAQAEAERKAKEEAAQAEAAALAAANSAETFYRRGREAAFGLKGKIDAELGFRLLQEAANQGSTDAMGALAVLYRDGCAATPPNSAKALELMKKAADAENPWGQYLLAFCYLTGAGVEKDKTRADALFEAARAGFAELADEDPLASTYLGWCYAGGRGGAKDCDEAARRFREAAETGCVDAMIGLASSYSLGQGVARDAKQAFEWYRKGAEAGNVVAMCELGWHYEMGLGVEKNETNAFEWYRKGAEAGALAAAFNLERCYANGIGVEKDDEKAFEWRQKGAEALQQSAEAGNAVAMWELGSCYADGFGVAQDDEKAFEWYEKSAEAGNAFAMFLLGQSYEYWSNVEKAFEWYRKSAEAGNAYAMRELGWRYENGLGVEKNETNAFEWYRKGAEAGCDSAMYGLGRCYGNGIGVAKDAKKAFEWYRKGAEAGDAYAMRELGRRYENGYNVAENKGKAFEWYRKGAEAGCDSAMYDLGRCYENGIGVAKDAKKAFEWYRKGAEAGNPGAMDKLGYCYENGVGAAKNLVEAERWYRKAMEFGPAEAINAEAGLERIGRWKKTSVRF